MSKKLFVGNLPFEVNDADLGAVLGVAGTVVSAKVVINKKTGRSKGYGFVEMETEEMAKEAVTKFEGATLNERAITVQVATPKMEKDEAATAKAEAAGAATEMHSEVEPTAGTPDEAAEGARETEEQAESHASAAAGNDQTTTT